MAVEKQSKITNEQLARRAIVYVRQSTATQLRENEESRRRQYGLKTYAEELGFHHVDVIDEDLGKSGSGKVERPGFQRLVAELVAGQVGAIFCIEASRLARNGRDWHGLIDVCGYVGALVIDPEGVYDPRLGNDRLLLGLKGSLSEYELTLLHQRSREAINSKAARGEYEFTLPIGFRWSANHKIEMDPDRRIQAAIHEVFQQFRKLKSARQVLLWFRGNRVQLPSRPTGKRDSAVTWKQPVYNTILKFLKNPLYAGAYAYGKTEGRNKMVGGRAQQTHGHRKEMDDWTVLIPDHHPGYISWEEYEANQTQIAENAYMEGRYGRTSSRGGSSLISGMLRCRRCGRMLHVTYSGAKGNVPRYHCRGAHLNHGTDSFCISFGGKRVDEAVSRELLQAVSPLAIQASVVAAEQIASSRRDRCRLLALELEQTQYDAQLAARRYEAVDPDNRLVAAELEARWNEALRHSRAVEKRLSELDEGEEQRALQSPEVLRSLAEDMESVWNDPAADMAVKHRIVRLLLEEIVADVDEEQNEVVLIMHWKGGCHSEIRVPKNRIGQHGHATSLEAQTVIERMVGKYRDDTIARTLNRLGLRTGKDLPWNRGRVATFRSSRGLPVCTTDAEQQPYMNLAEAARHLGVSPNLIRRLISSGALHAEQVVPTSPWEIPVEALDSEEVQNEVAKAKDSSNSRRRSRRQNPESRLFPEV